MLTNYELGGFHPAAVTVYRSLQSWLSDQQLPAPERRVEQTTLRRDGFRAAAREDLMNGGTGGLSIVEQFRSPQGAHRACASALSELERDVKQAGAYTPFTVPEVPDGAGVEMTAAAGTAVDIVFSDDSYLYLVAEFGGGRRTTANLIAAAQYLYQRVRR